MLLNSNHNELLIYMMNLTFTKSQCYNKNKIYLKSIRLVVLL